MSRTICIVEDTPDLLENLSQFLEMEGFVIVGYSSAKDAIQQLKSKIPDLIITDLWMPVMSGFDFIEKLKDSDSLKAIPIIIFSAKPIQEYEEKARLLGVKSFIKKPASLNDILKVIDDIIPTK
jgi:CheY-like chemotaxis protein